MDWNQVFLHNSEFWQSGKLFDICLSLIKPNDTSQLGVLLSQSKFCMFPTVKSPLRDTHGTQISFQVTRSLQVLVTVVRVDITHHPPLRTLLQPLLGATSRSFLQEASWVASSAETELEGWFLWAHVAVSLGTLNQKSYFSLNLAYMGKSQDSVTWQLCKSCIPKCSNCLHGKTVLEN